MSYDTPIDKTTGDIITAAGWNQDVVDNMIAMTAAGIELWIPSGGAAIAPGVNGYCKVPFKCTITEASIYVDTSATLVWDIWKCTHTQYDAGATHPVDGDSICAAANPNLSAEVKSIDTTLTGWSKELAKGDILWLNLDSNDNAKVCLFCIFVNRS
jgi:gamma-glutamyl phosphate reductase